MRAGKRLVRAFQPLDTSTVEAALDRLEVSTRRAHAEARVLRTTINCADCGAVVDAVRQLTGKAISGTGPRLRDVFGLPHKEPLPADMLAQLRKLD